MKLLTLKYTNMKKILFAALAALAITSCSQNEMDGIDNGQKGKAEIRFGYTPVTRATVTTTNSLGNFTVNAYSSEGATYSTDALDVISNGYFTKKKWRRCMGIYRKVLLASREEDAFLWI